MSKIEFAKAVEIGSIQQDSFWSVNNYLEFTLTLVRGLA
jgi:hypothetical protein